MNILILDGDHKNALAILRHLGIKKRYKLHVVSYQKASICFFSRYAASRTILPNPKKNPDSFVQGLIGMLQNKSYDVLLPVSYIAYQLCALHKEEIWKYTKLAIADYEHISLASSKIETYCLARELQIPYPAFYEIKNQEELKDLPIRFPCVVKAAFEAGKNIVEYAVDRLDLIEKYARVCRENKFDAQLPIVQEYISGEGVGFFAFYQHGVCKRFFMHRRVREYPVSGGASVCAESWYHPTVFEYGKRVLDHLGWQGVAMVEFKQDSRTGLYNLMEINAKFWGSLDLALAAGVDFPEYLIQDAMGVNLAPEGKTYRDITYQWVLNGELFHVIEKPSHLWGAIRDLFKSKKDIWLRDPGPIVFQFAYLFVHLYKKKTK
jgi:predicted ATP-grasp superfamily ATP-dependent carboligase